eukprot:6086864-Amphidinium_carterae.2
MRGAIVLPTLHKRSCARQSPLISACFSSCSMLNGGLLAMAIMCLLQPLTFVPAGSTSSVAGVIWAQGQHSSVAVRIRIGPALSACAEDVINMREEVDHALATLVFFGSILCSRFSSLSCKGRTGSCRDAADAVSSEFNCLVSLTPLAHPFRESIGLEDMYVYRDTYCAACRRCVGQSTLLVAILGSGTTHPVRGARVPPAIFGLGQPRDRACGWLPL